MTRRASPEVAGAHTLDADEARPSTAGCLPRWRCLTCSQLPRLFLSLWVLHPIRRHYTPSERVRCPLRGVLPPNGCRVSRALTEACPSSAGFAASRSRRCTRLRRLGVFDRDARLGPDAPSGLCSCARYHAKSDSFLPPGAQVSRYPLLLWPSMSRMRLLLYVLLVWPSSPCRITPVGEWHVALGWGGVIPCRERAAVPRSSRRRRTRR